MLISELKPFGAVINVNAREESLLAVDKRTIVEILDHHHLAVFRGYSPLSDEQFIRFAQQFGSLLGWEFGEILELKVQQQPANHIFTRGRVELHWDGAYVEKTPHYNMFLCLAASEEEVGGETLFVNTSEVIRKVLPQELEKWRGITVTYSTEKKAHYGGTIRQPLCSINPYNNQEVIRYIEAFNEDCEALNPVSICIENYSADESDQFLRSLNTLLYNDQVMYRHRWQAGDYLIADNSTLLHGRSRFQTEEPARRIKRINVL